MSYEDKLLALLDRVASALEKQNQLMETRDRALFESLQADADRANQMIAMQQQAIEVQAATSEGALKQMGRLADVGGAAFEAPASPEAKKPS